MNDCLRWSARELVTRLARREMLMLAAVEAFIERIPGVEG